MKPRRQLRDDVGQSWPLTAGLLDELRRACMQDGIVQARLKGFIQGKGAPENAEYELRLSAQLVRRAPGPAAKSNGG